MYRQAFTCLALVLVLAAVSACTRGVDLEPAPTPQRVEGARATAVSGVQTEADPDTWAEGPA